MSDDGKHELCREVGRCHAVIMQQEQIIAVLRAEVRAWRDGCHTFVADTYEQERAIENAMRDTDAAKALGES